MFARLRQRPAQIMLLLSVFACVFEGALRKWMFRDNAGVVTYACYFAKDFLFAGILLFHRRAAVNPTFRKVLLIGLPIILGGAVLSSVQQVNPVGAVLSIRALILLPIMACLVAPRLAGLNVSIVALAVGSLTAVNALLGLAQNSSAPDAPINYFASDTVGAVAFEENVRAMGTFSYITGFANLAEIGSWAGLVILCLARGRILFAFLGWAFYIASFTCALVSISRGTVLIVLAMLLVLALSGKQVMANLLKGAAAIIVLVVIGYAFNFNPVLERLSDTVIARHEAADDTVEGRTIAPFLESGVATAIAPFGAGLGTEQVGGVYAATGVRNLANFESQFARLVMETSLVGLIGFLVVSLGTIYVLFLIRKNVTDEGMRRVVALTIFLTASFFYINVAFNHIASYFAWLIVAVTLGSVSKPAAAPSTVRPQAQPWLAVKRA